MGRDGRNLHPRQIANDELDSLAHAGGLLAVRARNSESMLLRNCVVRAPLLD